MARPDVNNNWGAGQFPTADYDLDGDLDVNDLMNVTGAQWGVTLGWGKLSQGGAAGGNRHGYAGYEFEPVTAYAIWHVRNRALNSDLGRWTRRDPLSFVDGPNSIEYTASSPIIYADATGLMSLYLAPTVCRKYRCGGWTNMVTFLVGASVEEKRSCTKPIFVQKLRWSLWCAPCSTPSLPAPITDEIYEAFYFGNDSNSWNQLDAYWQWNDSYLRRWLLEQQPPPEIPTAAFDTWSEVSYPKSWGAQLMSAEIRLFCADKNPLVEPTIANVFQEHLDGPAQAGACAALPRVYKNAYRGPEPPFWNTGHEASANRSVASFWFCCPTCEAGPIPDGCGSTLVAASPGCSFKCGH